MMPGIESVLVSGLRCLRCLALCAFVQKKVAQDFDLNLWKRRFFEWMDTKKVRVIDVFRKFDAENKGKISREEFVTGLTNMGNVYCLQDFL